MPPDELYAINGLQFLPFNTIYQLAAEREGAGVGPTPRTSCLLPDLLAYWLTGELRTELTNASTTGLLDARTRQWSTELLDRLDIPASPAARRSTAPARCGDGPRSAARS